MELKELIEQYVGAITEGAKPAADMYEAIVNHTVKALAQNDMSADKANINNKDLLSVSIDTEIDNVKAVITIELNIISSIITVKADTESYEGLLTCSPKTKGVTLNQRFDSDAPSIADKFSQILMDIAQNCKVSDSTSIENMQAEAENVEAEEVSPEEMGNADGNKMFDITD